jgi:hypothetical protein
MAPFFKLFKMKHYFNTSELCIMPTAVPQEVVDKLWKHHILPMNRVREQLGAPITASQQSGYRPVAWELRQGRNGKSQHCFHGLGAVDWTTPGRPDLLDELQSLILEITDYTRIARYETFIHCDYRYLPNGTRRLYTSGDDSRWKLVREV